jgi:hypothetical protein
VAAEDEILLAIGRMDGELAAMGRGIAVGIDHDRQDAARQSSENFLEKFLQFALHDLVVRGVLFRRFRVGDLAVGLIEDIDAAVRKLLQDRLRPITVG